MGELSLYRIRDLARGSGRAVYSIAQLAALTGRSRATCRVYASRLVQRRLASRVLRGKITFVEDDLVIAGQLVEPSYISLDSALLFHGRIQQVPRYVESVTPRNSISREGIGLVYHKVPPGLFYGFERHGRAGSYALVAKPEKALVDGVYLGLYREPDVRDLMGGMDAEELRGLVRRFRGRGALKLQRMLL